ncbi:site-specific DNA-methyltransferase [Aliarcobacter butzleri]|uniref:site-specific DNA-methyltransferase n=1 Tax=Aliarcobacter butzleri TaxID=28197 RepID=UPI0021B31F4E|nr:site-specific DNA-methyltransferase [Aliarcobacter butzleri]MCT7586600.1 site-specific DNA-methyltransferase [Aliarcobacter butzleri]
MQNLDGKSMNIIEQNIEKLKEIFPEVFSEGKIDFSKLEEELGFFKEKSDERYNFTWNGKSEAKKIALTPSTGTLRPCKEESKDWDKTQNLYIEGDNLEVLKLLQKSYHKKVKMIYIDPPYNTGKDFVYKDNFRDNIKNYLEITGQVDSDGNKLSTNSETSGRYHSDWLNMMYPRLKLARNLLKDDGVIFISIDDNEVSNLRKLCDEIFGEDNFISNISRVMKTGGNKGRYFSPNIDYILVYAKNLLHTKEFRGQISDELIQKVYNQVETEGIKKGEKYRIMGLYQAGLDIRANQRYWIQCPDGTFVIPKGVNFPLTINNGEKIKPTKEDGIWKWIFEKYLEELEKGNIIFKRTETSSLVDENGNQSKWNIYNKIWLNDRLEDGRVPVNLIDKMENRHSSAELKTLEIPFDFAKPTELIKYLMTIVGLEQNDIVLDFFSGSATTGHSTIKYNSEDEKNIRFILVQLPELTDNKEFPTICEIGKERIRRAGEKVKSESGKDDLDIGFKVLKLDSSNIKSWDSDFENLETNLLDAVENIKSDRNEEDLLYEILLKYGLDLTLPIEEKEVNGKKLYNIGFGALIICLDSNISIDITDEIIAIKKEYDSEITRVVFKDSGFKNATEKTNIIKTLNQNGIDEVVSV